MKYMNFPFSSQYKPHVMSQVPETRRQDLWDPVAQLANSPCWVFQLQKRLLPSAILVIKTASTKNSLASTFIPRFIFKPVRLSALFKSALAYLDFVTHFYLFFFLCEILVVSGNSERNEVTLGRSLKSQNKISLPGGGCGINSSLRKEQRFYYSTLNKRQYVQNITETVGRACCFSWV